jgi:exodeoxyribonuclease V alpha subunit
LYPARRAFIRRAEHHLKLAYCLTCHKMQGSEVDAVVLPLHRSIARLPMVSREWLYTAVSRAKKILITVGDLDALAPMVARVGTNQRNTMLQQLFEKLNRPQPLEMEL